MKMGGIILLSPKVFKYGIGILYHDLILTILISIIRGRAQKWHNI